MLPQNPDTGAFWQAFCRHAGLEHDNYVVGSFGDSPEMATELADLVIAGIKRATASLARDYGEGPQPPPRPGDFVLVLGRVLINRLNVRFAPKATELLHRSDMTRCGERRRRMACDDSAEGRSGMARYAGRLEWREPGKRSTLLCSMWNSAQRQL